MGGRPGSGGAPRVLLSISVPGGDGATWQPSAAAVWALAPWGGLMPGARLSDGAGLRSPEASPSLGASP